MSVENGKQIGVVVYLLSDVGIFHVSTPALLRADAILESLGTAGFRLLLRDR